jgi:hypothetical protein
LNGVNIDAGSYELFTIPNEEEWTVILHANRSQWGSYSYDASNDVARIRAVPERLASAVESFTISLEEVTNSRATLNIAWDRVRVPVDIQIDVRATVVPRLEEALRSDGKRPYFQAAMFYYENDLDIDRAAELIGLAVAAAPTHIGMLYRQALILAAKGDPLGAIQAAERSLAGAANEGRELREEYTRLNTNLLEKLRNRPGVEESP